MTEQQGTQEGPCQQTAVKEGQYRAALEDRGTRGGLPDLYKRGSPRKPASAAERCCAKLLQDVRDKTRPICLEHWHQGCVRPSRPGKAAVVQKALSSMHSSQSQSADHPSWIAGCFRPAAGPLVPSCTLSLHPDLRWVIELTPQQSH